MKFGLFYVLEVPDQDYLKAWNRMLGQIEYAEELGYDSIWLAEHHGSTYGSIPRLPIAAAAVAQRTSKMRIGTAVAILPFSNPVRIAEDFAMVDVISNGRLDLGVGRAYQPLEFKNMGLEGKQPYSRELFQESLEIVLGLWENEKFSYTGKHFQIEDVEVHPRPIQKPIPIHVAATSPGTFATVADMGLNIIQAATLSPIDELKDLALQAKRILVKKGRSPESLDFPLLWITHVAKTLEEARARSEEPLKWYYNKIMSLVPRGSFSPKSYEAFAEAADAWFAAGGIPVEKLNELGNLVMGTPEYAAKRMAEVHNDIGQQEVILWMQIGGMEDNYVRDSMKSFADEVFPILKGKPAVVPPTLAEIAASRS
jgi:alkanesulfonate monooxygenase SsuD/methylene tetrahydromethanopterin reductase-like flavin-dependent oxidoreductase (luciferase family)